MKQITYGIGSGLPHRGYYCPSLIQDFVIGGSKRGKIVKKKPVTDEYREYGFDSHNTLIYAAYGSEEEFLFYKKNTEIGITYDGFLLLLECCHLIVPKFGSIIMNDTNINRIA